MNYQVEIGGNNDIPLSDDLCRRLNFEVGDILLYEKLDNMMAIVHSKYIDQSLTDALIESAGNLTRVIPLSTRDISLE